MSSFRLIFFNLIKAAHRVYGFWPQFPRFYMRKINLLDIEYSVWEAEFPL